MTQETQTWAPPKTSLRLCLKNKFEYVYGEKVKKGSFCKILLSDCMVVAESYKTELVGVDSEIRNYELELFRLDKSNIHYIITNEQEHIRQRVTPKEAIMEGRVSI